MDTALDAVGQPLSVGDHVAHVSRFGSSFSIKRRIIAEVRAKASITHRYAWGVRLVPLPGQKSPSLCQPHNLVRITAP